MKLFARFLLILSLMMTMGAVAHAQSPREQLQQMVQQLQRNPSDNALRERIIKLAQEIKPPPAIAEEARRHFVEGTVIAKSAKDPKGQALAVESFKEALKIAPWWGDAYYNLAVVQELAGQFDDAEQSLRHYILTNPADREAREAQDRIYALSAKKKLAQRHAEEAEESDRRKQQAFIQNLAGIWRTGEADMAIHYGYEVYRLEITGNNRFTMTWLRKEGGVGTRMLPYEATYSGSISSTQVSGIMQRLWLYDHSGRTGRECEVVRSKGAFDGSISEDGNVMRIAQRWEGLPSCDALRNPWGGEMTFRKAR